jgi:xanthosine utilization system XapX-like protein
MNSAAKTAVLGFVAAALAVLTFHQGMWEALHLLSIDGLKMPTWYPMEGVPPFGVPKILSLCFWGGLYGIPFALLMRRFTLPLWLCGLVLGLIAMLVGNFVVPVIKGLPVGGGWVAMNWVRSSLINGFWGIGVGIIAPLLLPQSVRR